MSTQLQLRGGTTAENLLFTGAQREVTVDTDRNTLRVHDGVTAGGFALATQDEIADGTYFYNDDTSGGSAANAYILVPKANTIIPNTYEDGVLFGFVTANANTGPASASFQGLGVKSIKLPGGADPAPGEVSGRVTLVFDAGNDWLELQRKPTGAPPQLRTIGASVVGNAMTVTLEPCLIDFRNSTLNSGVILSRVVTTTISLVIPSGATLGTQSGVANRLAVIAIDNAGVVELAVINLATITTLNESGLINTTAISAAATSATTFYSAAARVNVPYRVVGMVASTQSSAGVWATPPSTVQGSGGQAIFGLENRMFFGTSQNTTSGTAIDFTGIPVNVNRVTLSFNAVSTSGTSSIQIQIGAGSIDATGYNGATSSISGGVVTNNLSTGITLDTTSAAAALVQGAITFTRISGNTWAFTGTAGRSDNGRLAVMGGSKALSGSLDRVRITTVNGTDTFDNGAANLIWEL